MLDHSTVSLYVKVIIITVAFPNDLQVKIQLVDSPIHFAPRGAAVSSFIIAVCIHTLRFLQQRFSLGS